MTCPGCGAGGDGEKSLAENQRWCPRPREECRVVTYTEEPNE